MPEPLRPTIPEILPAGNSSVRFLKSSRRPKLRLTLSRKILFIAELYVFATGAVKIFARRQVFRARLFFEGLAVGIFTGVVVTAIRILLDAADILRPQWFAHFSAPKFFITVCAIIFVAEFLARAIKFDGQVAGSGVPQIKGMLLDVATMTKPVRLILLKFTATVLGIGAGLSLGRAGVSVQFGACVGNFFGKVFYRHHGEIERGILLTAGAGAGLAAIFNAPLAGIIFCVEELHKKFTPEVLVATLTATVSAAAVVNLVFGVHPIFAKIGAVPVVVPEFLNVVHFVALGIFLGVVGVIFTRTMILALNFYDRLKIFGARRFLIPLALVIPLGVTLPEVLGCGNVLVDEILSEEFMLRATLIFFAGKFLFTLVSFGTGAPGGVFLPLLTLGALGGSIFADVGIVLGFFGAEWSTLLIIFGMAAMFAAVVKAPVTGSILIMEITGQFSYLLTLTVVAGAAFMTADLLGGEPIFSALLNRSLRAKN